MFNHSSSNRPSPRRPRDRDEWIAVIVAFGTLGGLAGWLIAGAGPVANGDRRSLESLLQTPSEPAAIAPSPPIAVSPDAALDTEAPDEAPPPNDQAQPTAPGATSAPPAPDPLPTQALPPLPTTDDPAVPPPPPAPPVRRDVPLTVPEPQIPASDRAVNLPTVRPPLVFRDVPEGFWAKPYIDALTARGVLNGLPEGRFEPDRPLTRAELAAQVANAFEIEPRRSPKQFNDVTADYWASAPIQKSVATGFMSGYPGGIFRPDETLPRLEVFIALAAGLSLPVPNGAETLLAQYRDEAAIPDWAREQVASAIAAGMITASPTTENLLRPTDPATRAEVAALIYKALAYMGKVEPIE